MNHYCYCGHIFCVCQPDEPQRIEATVSEREDEIRSHHQPVIHHTDGQGNVWDERYPSVWEIK